MSDSPKKIGGWFKDVPPHIIATMSVAGAGLIAPHAREAWDALRDQIERPIPLALFGALCVSGAMHLWERHCQNRRAPVALLVYPFVQRHFRAQLVAGLAAEVGQRGLSVIIRTPADHHDAEKQVEQLADLVSHRAAYRGALIVAATASDVTGDVLAGLVAAFGRPAVFVDVEPFLKEGEYPANAAYVGIDGRSGGHRAAEALASALPKGCGANVLVVASNVQRNRQLGFNERFAELVPGATVRVTEDGGMERADSYRVVRAWLDAAAADRITIDALVATNDEMAIGAVHAIAQHEPTCGARPVVIGYDGIPEAIEMIDSEATPLINTVVQPQDTLVRHAAAVLTQLIDGINVKRFHRIAPYLYRPVPVTMRPAA
jgi:ABC-type sugar transport system substrate-binding protein